MAYVKIKNGDFLSPRVPLCIFFPVLLRVLLILVDMPGDVIGFYDNINKSRQFPREKELIVKYMAGSIYNNP